MFFSARFWFAAVLCFCGALPLRAHDPGLSSAEVEIRREAILVTLTLNARDAQLAGISSPSDLRENFFEIASNGHPLAATTAVGPTADQNNNVECRLTFPRKTGSLTVRAPLLARLPFGHREYVKIHDEQGRVLAEQLLSLKNDSCAIALADRPGSEAAREKSPTFLNFLVLGIQHILTGYDHLLFLCGLLLVCASFRQAAAIITCFTAAHSITLALATFHVVTLSSRIVEPAIAASITYVGVENILRRGQVKWRWILTFAFGLVHGLGFATALEEMGIGSGSSGIVLPLVSFNVGVELGQLSVAALALPLIFALRRKPAFLRVGIPASSLMIALAGAIWFLQRTL